MIILTKEEQVTNYRRSYFEHFEKRLWEGYQLQITFPEFINLSKEICGDNHIVSIDKSTKVFWIIYKDTKIFVIKKMHFPAVLKTVLTENMIPSYVKRFKAKKYSAKQSKNIPAAIDHSSSTNHN